MTDVLGLGQSSLDYLSLAPDFPAEDHKLEVAEPLVQGGGPVATALVALARLGFRTTLLGRVGDDRFGAVIRDGLAAEGVEVTHLLTKPGSSQFAFILVIPGRATRTILWSRGSAAELAPEEIPPGLVEGARLLHLDGLMAAASLAAARRAKAARVPVVLDMGTLRPQFEPLARLTDHLLVSEHLAAAFAPGSDLKEALVRLHGLGPAVAAVTLGRRGCLAYDGRRYYPQPAFPVRAVDTTGAGDAFHGGYIAGLLDGLPLAGRLRLAAAVAALACAALGGRSGLPDRGRLNEFLKGA